MKKTPTHLLTAILRILAVFIFIPFSTVSLQAAAVTVVSTKPNTGTLVESNPDGSGLLGFDAVERTPSNIRYAWGQSFTVPSGKLWDIDTISLNYSADTFIDSDAQIKLVIFDYDQATYLADSFGTFADPLNGATTTELYSETFSFSTAASTGDWISMTLASVPQLGAGQYGFAIWLSNPAAGATTGGTLTLINVGTYSGGEKLRIRGDTGNTLPGSDLNFVIQFAESDAHPIAHWDFTEGSGTTLTDLVNSDVATAAGTTAWANDGGPGSNVSLRFDGVTGELSTPETASVNVDGSFTVMAWVKPTEPFAGGGDSYFTVFSSSASDTGYSLWVDRGTDKWAVSSASGIGTTDDLIDAGNVTYGVWTHVAFSYSVISGPVGGYYTGDGELYVNGRLANTFANMKYQPSGAATVYMGSDGTGNRLDGRISDLQFHNAALDAGRLSYSIYPNDQLTAHYPFSEGLGTMTEDAVSGIDATVGAGAAWDTDSGDGSGSSLSFDGSAAGVTAPASAANHVSGSFTVAGWVKPAAGAVDPFSTLFTSFGSDAGYALRIDRGSDKWAVSSASGIGTTDEILADSEVTYGEWSYVAFTYQVTEGATNGYYNGTGELYVNGNQVSSVTGMKYQPSVSSAVYIGHDNNTNRFEGTIDDVKFYSYALDAATLASLYSSTEFPRGLAAHWTFDGLGTAGTVTESVSSTETTLGTQGVLDATAKYGASSYRPDMTNGGFEVPTDAAISMDESFTVAAWVSVDAAQLGNTGLLFQAGDFQIQARSTDLWRANVSGGGATSNITGTIPVADNGWHHIAVTWNAKSLPLEEEIASQPLRAVGHTRGTLQLYVDGVLDGNGTNHYQHEAGGAVRTIGSAIGGATPINGLIDDLRIYNYAMSADQIYDMGADYPTEKIAHYDFSEGEGTVLGDSAGANDGTLMGDPVWSDFAPYGINYSLQLDGDDYVQLPRNGALEGDFTVCLWARPERHVNGTDAPNTMSLIGADNFQMDAMGPNSSYDYQGKFMPSNQKLNPGTRATTNKWRHLTVVYEAGGGTLYLDGIDIDYNGSVGFAAATGGFINIGANVNGNLGFVGRISDIRIFNRALDQAEVNAICDIRLSNSFKPGGGLHATQQWQKSTYWDHGDAELVTDPTITGSNTGAKTPLHYADFVDTGIYPNARLWDRERAAFGYNPRFDVGNVNRIGFGPGNMPYLISSSNGKKDGAETRRSLIPDTMGYKETGSQYDGFILQTLDKDGNWITYSMYDEGATVINKGSEPDLIALNPMRGFEEMYKGANPGHGGFVVVFDYDGDAYVMMPASSDYLLLHSTDNLQTWTVYNLGRHNAMKLAETGPNTLPIILNNAGGYNGLMGIVEINKNPDGTLSLEAEVNLGMILGKVGNSANKSGGVAETSGGKVHIAYYSKMLAGRNNDMMPVHVLTYDRSTNTVDSDTIVGHTWASSGDNGVYKPDSAMATSGTNPGAINDLSVPDGHNLTDLVADEDDYLHFIGAGHNSASLYLMSSSPGDSTSWNFQSYNQNWIGYGVEKKTTYPCLAICPDTGNLYYTARATVRSGDAGLFANTDRHRGVLFMRKLRTGPGTYSDWEDMGVLNFSHTPGYSSFTQNVSVDNKGSIYINYRFHSPDNNTANPGGNSFIQAYQDEAILRFPEMTDPNDSIGYDPVSLVSHDYGLTFHLTTTADFFANIDKPDFAPSGVSASLVNLSAVTVAWTDASSNESGFRVERQASGGDWTVLADTAAGVETYTDNTMAVGGSYTYRVQALAAGLNSPYALSNTVAVSAYAVWQLMYPGVGIGSADDDADGLVNDTEYLFGSDPLSGVNQARILLGINATYPEITYTRRSYDAVYVIQTSLDLTSWVPTSMTPISLVLNADGTETVTYQSLIDYSTESGIFFRVEAND